MTWLNKGHEFWDQTLLKELLEDLPESDREIVIVPGTINTIGEVNKELKKYSKVLLIVTSDEENSFPIDEIYHPDKVIYVTYPKLTKHQSVDRFLPIGYPPDTKMVGNSKQDLDWYFAGQVNTPPRKELVSVLKQCGNGVLNETAGFAQGYSHKDYYENLSRAKIVPCPGGPHSPDSFRLYETLETGAIPIPDNPDFWKMLFKEVPFPSVLSWSQLPDLINNLKDRPEVNNKCMAWWQRTKRELSWMIEDDIKADPGEITVLVPTSTIPSHPSTHIIEETINSVRAHLPKAEIILMIDGLREKQADRHYNYGIYIRDLLWKCKEWGNIYPMIFETHQHQANMTREAMKKVRTPFVMFVEQDCPITPDREIPFERFYAKIRSGESNLVRLMHEAYILEPHKHLMLDTDPIDDFTRTVQFSARPNIASSDYYRWFLDEFFSRDSRTYIEDNLYGVIENAWLQKGLSGWNDHKIVIYTPEGDMKRSYHIDGREGDSKWNDDLVF